jgi:two-component system, LytTR family, response regulator LytT
MRVAIIEDEHLLADELEDMLHELNPSVEVVAKLGSVASSIEWLGRHTCDLIFLDVHLSDGLSFAIFDKVSVSIPIIFTTAFDSYSLKAFELNSISYLLKPIELDKLEGALSKYRSLQPPIEQLMEFLRSGEASGRGSYKRRFILSMGAVQRPVEAEEVAFFMADNKHLFAFTRDGRKYFYDSTLARLVEELDPKQFFRINRKYYVNISSVRELLPYSKSRIKVKLAPETEDDVIISYARANDFKRWLSE